MDISPSLGEDQDLQEIWPQIVAEYEHVTGEKLDPRANFDAITQKIDQDIRKSQSRNNTRARKIVSDVGRCLQQFGGMIAQAASVAFGPSAQCWNAISFVISAAQSYRDILDGFVALMEHSLAFLKRLNFFLDQHKTGVYLDPHLRGPAYAILKHFLDLLKFSHGLATRKREKFKLVLNIVLFNGDAGVHASLSQMEALVLSFTHSEIDQILVDVKGLARYMHESAEDTQRRHGELKEHFERTEGLLEHTVEGVQNISKRLDSRFSKEQMKGFLKKIRDALQLDDNSDTWSKRQYTICTNRTVGTATWLLEDMAFRSWSDVLDVHSNKVMMIRGESGFGKSYLFSHVVTSLEEKYPRSKSQDRTYVLYYYFGEAEKEDSLRRCLSAMIYQLANLDESGKFATAIAEACEQSAKIATAESLWDLFLVTFQSTVSQGKCFLCIDGFAAKEDRAPSEIIANMARQAAHPQSDLKGCSVRMFVTATSSDVTSIPFDDEVVIDHRSLGPDPGSDSDSNASVADVMEPFTNQGDLMVVAQARVQELRTLKPEIGSLLTETDIQAIVTGVKGHYENLESKLKQISACSCYEDVREIIDKADEGFTSTTQNSIKSLNETLNPEAIAQLNELLRWIKGCRTWTKLDLLQSALVFTLGKTLFLKTMIKTRLSTLLTLDDQDVVTGPDGLRDILSSADLAEADAISTDRAVVVLNEAEVELCRRFIRNACGAYDFERFQFDDFFNAHAGRQVSKIRLDSEEVLELTILQTCVKSLAERQEDLRFLSLRKYASVWFYEHLVTVLNNMEIFDYEKNILRDVGTSLASLLYEDVAIDAWWNDDDLGTLRNDWLLRDENFHEALWKFVRHRSVAQGYAGEDEDEAWLRDQATSGSNGYSILLRVASRLAGRWFGRNLANEYNFWAAFTIVARANEKEHDGMSMPSVEEIDEFIKWVQENSGLGIEPTQWTFRRGASYILCEYMTEGIDALLQAEKEGYSDWALPLKLAEVYCERNNYAAALQYCHKFAEHKDKSAHDNALYSDGSGDSYDGAYYGRVLLREGECHKNLNSPQSAIQCYMQVLAHEDTFGDAHQEALYNLFEVWRESREYSAVLDLFRAWRDTPEPGLFYWIMKIAYLNSVHRCLLDTARSTACHEEVIDAYKLALQTLASQSITDDDETKRAVIQLRYVLAGMLYYGSDSDDNHQEALDIWESLVVAQNDAMNSWAISLESARKLFRSLSEKASKITESSECQYTPRLANLATMEHEDIRFYRSCGKDPRLSLARIQHSRGQTEEARLTLRERLRSAFDGWSDENDDDDKLAARYSCLAHTLGVICDDTNAIAAWQASKPKAKNTTDEPVIGDDAAAEQAVAGAEANLVDSSDQPLLSVSQDPEVEVTKEEAPDSTDDEETPIQKREPYQDGYYCDGECGDDFDVSSNAFVCRDCLDVQFCTKCHVKVKDGQLSPTICSSLHEFLFVPAVDEVLWEKLEADQMLVGDTVISRTAWIDGMREQWNLQQEQIDTEKLEAGRKLKAARCIAQFILNWKRGQRRKPAALSGIV